MKLFFCMYNWSREKLVEI